MELRRLDNNNYKKILSRPIYLVSYDEVYLKELCEAYNCLAQIRGVVTNEKEDGEYYFNDTRIATVHYNNIENVPRNSTFIIINDYYREVFDEFVNCVGQSIFVSEIFFFANKETSYDLDYREKYKNTVLRNIIIFRSGPHASCYIKGMDFWDNAKVLFEYMLKQGLNKRYEMVWIVKEPEEFQDKYSIYQNVRFVPFAGSYTDDKDIRDEYYAALCLAKYIFFTDAYGFARNARADQIRIQLWHGCGIKTRMNFTRCERRYEYMTVTSELYAKLHEDSFGLSHDQILITGLAKEDLLYHPVENWLDKLFMPDIKRYIFWLPTFRKTQVEGLHFLDEEINITGTGLPIVDSKEKFEELNQLLVEKNVGLVIKLHPFQDRKVVSTFNLSNIILLENEQLFENGIQINELLGRTDALISDYSSVAVDYTLLDKPIAFTLDDYKEYQNTRAFHWENVRDWLPGKEIFQFEDMKEFIIEVAENIDSTAMKRNKLKKVFHKYSDDRNCERIISVLGIDTSNYSKRK